MPLVAPFPQITSLDLYKTESNPSTNVGQLAATTDGRMFRYVKAGGVTTVRGNLLQSPANDSNFKDMSVQAAVAVGATTIPVTLGGTSTTAGQFVGGTLVISVTPGIGQVFTIVSHDVATNGTTCNFNVLEPVQVALTTSSKATTQLNPYMGVIAQPTTSTGMAVGGSVTAITNAQYGWIQTHGMGGALSDATVTSAAAFALSPSVTTAGTVTKAVTLQQVVGQSMVMVTVSAQVEPIFWLID